MEAIDFSRLQSKLVRHLFQWI